MYWMLNPPVQKQGEGRARIEVNYRPQEGIEPVEEEPVDEDVVLADEPITIDVFDDLNALLIRYDDPALFAEVLDWIDQFDRPTKQVQVTTKVVEVDDVRAKQMSIEWDFFNIGEASIDLENRFIEGAFGSDLAEATQSTFESSVESLDNAALLKGTTILNFLFWWQLTGQRATSNV